MNDDSRYDLKELDYVRNIGAYKPHFEGISEYYYPLTCFETSCCGLILFLTIGLVLAMMIGFLFWVQGSGLDLYVIVWSAGLLFFMLICIMLLYKGGKERRSLEKAMIEENNAK